MFIRLLLCLISPAMHSMAGLPPIITTQPTNQTVQIGGTAAFVVVASSGTTLGYQWYFKSNSIAGATNNTYMVSNAQTTNAGTYYAAVMNADGTVYSSNAVLTVMAAAPPWYNGAWLYRKAITIYYTNISANLTNFPVLINRTDSDLQAHTRTNGYDLLFTSADGTNKLAHEIESYAGSNGTLIAWVKVPNLSSTVNTLLYLYYGNASAANQQNVTNVWDSNFKGVWHLNETSDTFKDSTSLGNNGNSSVTATDKTGKIGDGQALDGTDDYVEIGSSRKIDTGTAGTISAWVQFNSISAQGTLFNYGGGSVSGNGGELNFRIKDYSGPDHLSVYQISNGGSTGDEVRGSTTLSANTWYHVAVVSDGADYFLYVNGKAETLTVVSGSNSGDWLGDTTASETDYTTLGRRREDGAWSYPLNGNLDEVRYSSSVCSAAWIATEYKNQNSPMSFSSVASQETPTPKLAIAAVNGGVSPTAGSQFDVIVQAQDKWGVLQSATNNTVITLSLKTGNGTLGGTLIGTILAGSNSVTISGVTYTKAESGVVLTATRTSGDSLAADDSSPFMVNVGAVSATQSTVSANPGSVTANGVDGSTITVTLKDANNNPVSGKTVTLGKSGGSSTISAASGPSDVSGVVTFSVTDTVAETTTYTATNTTDAIILSHAADVSFISTPWYNGAWSYRKVIVISHTNVTADLTNFPVLISRTDSDFQARAQTNGCDLLFTADDGTTKLAHEIESYVSSNGTLVAWVKVPLLSSTVDTTLYLYYGNSLATNQQNATNVWDSNFIAVWHFGDVASPAQDSTSNNEDATQSGGVTFRVAGQIGSALQLSTNNNQFLTVSVASNYNFTASMWVYFNPTENSKWPTLFTSQDSKEAIYYYQGKLDYWYGGKEHLGGAISSNAWHYVAVANNAGTVNLYVDGVLTFTTNGAPGMPVHALGYDPTSLNGRYGGKMDEARYSTAARPSAWIAAEYRNQGTPGTFAMPGGQETPIATKLAITSINGGDNPLAGIGFSVVVQAQANGAAPAKVTTNTTVILSLKTGSGVLAGTLTGTITNGTSSVTLSGITYSQGESGVVITATRISGDNLAVGDSSPFTVIYQADVAVSAVGATNVVAGDNLTYTLTLTNAGPHTSSNLVVSDTLPLAAAFVSASGGGVSSNGVVTWTMATLPSGDTTNFTVTVTAPASGVLTNTVTSAAITSDPDSSNNNGSAPAAKVITGVTPMADLKLVKTGPATSISPAANFNYTISITNLGPSAAGSVTVTDGLPANVTFVSASSGGSTNGGNVIWTNLGNLAFGATTNLTLTVKSPLRGSITNVASVGSPTLDLNLTDNLTPPVTTTVSNVPPVANNDSYSTPEDTVLTVTAGGVLTNDTDVNGEALTALLVTGPTKGTLTLNTNGSFTFTPTNNYNGADSFTYRANDGTTNSGLATVTITVTPADDAPVAVADSYAISEDSTLVVAPLAVNLSNWWKFDDEGSSQTVVDSGPPGHHGTRGSTTGVDTSDPARTAGYIGTGALSFDGNADYVSTPSTVVKTAGAFTLSAWFKTDTTTGPHHILWEGYSGGNGFGDSASPGPATCEMGLTIGSWDQDSRIVFFLGYDVPANGANPISIVSASNFTDTNQWHHVAVTVTNLGGATSGGSLYVDGVLEGTDTGVQNDRSQWVSLLIGKPGAAQRYFDGQIDEVRIYDTALSAAQIIAIAQAGVLQNDWEVEGSPIKVNTNSVTSPANGTLVINPDGSFVYTPRTNFAGTDTFTYKASDGALDSIAATVTITVSNINDAPSGTSKTVTALEDGPYPFAVTDFGLTDENDSLSNALLAVKITTLPAAGTLADNDTTVTAGQVIPVADISAGLLRFTGATNANGNSYASFTFQVQDNGGTANGGVDLDPSPKTFTINVTPVNDIPVANTQSVSTAEDEAKAITLTGSDVDGPVTNFTVVTQPTRGTVSGTAPILIYMPATNYNGSDSFAFTVNDGSLTSAVTTVTITVTPINDAPIASSQSVTNAEDTALAITLAGTDVDGDTLTFSVVNAPTNGVLSGLDPISGTATYTPNTNFNGGDSFTFRVSDGYANSATATVSITVTAVNDVPAANDQSVITPEDTAKAIILTSSDVDGPVSNFTIVTPPTNGTLSGTVPNLTYLPATNHNGADSFTFTVNDGSLTSAVANVTITVTTVNDAPVANSQSVDTTEDTLLPITLNGSDVDGPAVNFTIVSPPAHGTLSGPAPNVTYLPATNCNGADSFTFAVNDGSLTSSVATVSITVTPVNDAPAANNDVYTSGKNTGLTIPAPGVLGNDADPDGDALTALIVIDPGHGVLTMNTNGGFTYSPASNYFGADAFIYQVGDGATFSLPALVNLIITNINRAPVANNQSVTATKDTQQAMVLTASDADDDALTYAIVTPPAHGVIGGFNTNTGALTYTPADGYTGPDSFTFRANDGYIDSASAVVSLTVTQVLADVATTVVGPADVFAAVNFSYVISVTNLGPATASNLSVTDSLPASFVVVAGSSTPGAALNAGQVIWTNLGPLAAGTSTNLVLTVTPLIDGGFTNTVSSTAVTDDPDSSNNNGTAAAAKVVTTVYTTPVMSVQRVPGGGFQVQFTTLPNKVVSVLVSTNLLDWQTLFTTNSGNGAVVFIDSDAVNHLKRFYRCVTVLQVRPTLTAQRLPGGAFQVQSVTLASTTISIQVSTNLLVWDTLLTTNSGNGYVGFTDYDAPNHPIRFYRTVQ